MMLLADFSSFLGSIWFSIIVGVAGYIAGQIFPISRLMSLINRNR